MDTDRRAGKRTLVVRLGRDRARHLFAAMVMLSFAVVIAIAGVDGRPELLVTLLAAPLAPPLVRTVSSRTDGPSLNLALARCGALLAVFSLLLSAGLLLS